MTEDTVENLLPLLSSLTLQLEDITRRLRVANKREKTTRIPRSPAAIPCIYTQATLVTNSVHEDKEITEGDWIEIINLQRFNRLGICTHPGEQFGTVTSVRGDRINYTPDF